MATVVTTPAQAHSTHAHPLTAPLAGWHLLSLDAPCVAALWTVFLARCFGVALPWIAPVALGLAVWVLYAMDRLADAQACRDTLAERHHFHEQHRFAFIGAILGAILPLSALVVMLPEALRAGWLLMALPLLLYVVAVHALHLRKVPKEHLVAVFFACATSMPVLVSHAHQALLPVMVAFGALCWLNCVAIARWEHAHNVDAITGWAAKHFPVVACAVASLALLAAPTHIPVAIACLLSAALLLLLDGARTTPVLRRALADAALLTPLLLWPFLPR